jgi:very-short-patch-repair endonuclease
VVELVDPRAGSIFESITRVTLVVAGIVPPHSQFEVYDANGRWIGRVDFAWPSKCVILECDGFEYHGDRDAFERDRRRWTALVRAGWRVAIVTWRDVADEPAYLIEVVTDLLAA